MFNLKPYFLIVLVLLVWKLLLVSQESHSVILLFRNAVSLSLFFSNSITLSFSHSKFFSYFFSVIRSFCYSVIRSIFPSVTLSIFHFRSLYHSVLMCFPLSFFLATSHSVVSACPSACKFISSFLHLCSCFFVCFFV